MALYAVTGTTDLTTKGKRLASVHIATTGTASVVNLNDGVSGTTRYQFNGAINSDKTFSWTVPGGLPLFLNGIQVQLASGKVAAITLDIL
jgi:hypothetical protein